MTEEEDRLFQRTGRTENFALDARVAKAFDNMTSRGIPFYNEMQYIQPNIIVDFLPEDSIAVCGLGCSKCQPTADFVGYDNSRPMLDAIKQD